VLDGPAGALLVPAVLVGCTTVKLVIVSTSPLGAVEVVTRGTVVELLV
jgi:hypothetical protein